MRVGVLITASLAIVVLGPQTVSLATPIALVPNSVNTLRDTRGVNTVGIGSGNLIQYGADIQGGSAGTFISAFNGGFTDPAAACSPLAVNPNFCANGYGFSSSLLTGTTIRFTNGPDSLNVAAPSLVGAENPVPFPVSVTITAGATPTTPIISWVIPGGFVPVNRTRFLWTPA